MATKTAEDRIAEYVTKATNEFARIAQKVNAALEAKEAGKYYSKDLLDRDLGAMSVLSDSLALLTGTDHIVQTFKLEKDARARRGEVFPYSTFLGSQEPIWPEKH